MDFLKKFFAEFGNQLFKYRNVNMFDLFFFWAWIKGVVPFLDGLGWSHWVIIPLAFVILFFHHTNSWYGHKFFATE